jgi:hypothetical protein
MQPPWSEFRLFNHVAALKEAEFGGNRFGRIRQEIVRDGLPGVTVVTLLASPHNHSLRKVALLRVTARYCFWDSTLWDPRHRVLPFGLFLPSRYLGIDI